MKEYAKNKKELEQAKQRNSKRRKGEIIMRKRRKNERMKTKRRKCK